MAERFTIYAGEPVANILAGYEDNRSGRINQVAADFGVLIRELTPELTVAEWQTIAEVLNGTVITDESNLKFIWASIADSAEDGIGDKWGVDVEALAQHVRSLKIPQLIALREIIARYWNSIDGSTNYVELFQKCGARIRSV